ncbi:MAG: c-type cytochrome [Cellvibrionaceae bacterium]
MFLKRIYVPLTIALLFLMVGCSKDPDLEKGAEIYSSVCKVCHAQGINGAPVYGNKKMWSKRTDKGLDALVQNASNGFGLMPAKGGRTELTEDEIRAAIKHMLAALEK